MCLYFDSAPIIYHIERTATFAVSVDARLAGSGTVLVSSELARLECPVFPPRSRDAARETELDMFFDARVDALADFTGAIFRLVAEIRATHGFKTSDALHLAAPVAGGCTAFPTNDAQLARFSGLAVEVL